MKNWTNRRKRCFYFVFLVIISLSIIQCSCKSISILEKVEKKSPEYVFDRAEAVMEAYYDADFDAITELSNGKFSEVDFLAADWQDCDQLFNALTEDMDWEVNRESIYTEPSFSVEVEMEHSDVTAVIDDWLTNDKEFRSMISCLVQREMGEIGYEEFYSIYFPWMAEKYPEALKEVGTISFSTEVKFEYDAESDEWYLSELPADFTLCSNRFNFSPLTYLSLDSERLFTLQIARQMVYNNELLEKQYYDLYEFYYDRYFSSKIVPVSEVQDALDIYSFVDPETFLPINAPPLGANQLKFVMSFTDRFEEVAFYYRLYKGSAIPENLVKGDKSYFTDLWSNNIVIFEDQLLGGLKQGEYIFRVELEMGGIVLEEEFTVK